MTSRWPLFYIKIENNRFVISGNGSIFNLIPDSKTFESTKKLIDKEHARYKTEILLNEKFKGLNFCGMSAYVKKNGVYTGYDINPDVDFSITMRELSIINQEVELIEQDPDKYTFCSYCRTVVPKDYVAGVLYAGVFCKHCEHTKPKMIKKDLDYTKQ